MKTKIIKFLYKNREGEIKKSDRTYIRSSVEILSHFWNHEKDQYNQALLLTLIQKVYERNGEKVDNMPYLTARLNKAIGKMKYAYAKEFYTDRASDSLKGEMYAHIMIAFNSNDDDKIINRFRDLLNQLLATGQIKRAWISEDSEANDDAIPGEKSNINTPSKWRIHNLQNNLNGAMLHSLYLAKDDNQKQGVGKKIITSRIHKTSDVDMRINPFIGFVSAKENSRSTGLHYFDFPVPE